MQLDRFDAAPTDLDPGEGEVATAELVVEDDVLVKAFALGPGATLDPHDHPDSTNVFHVLRGSATVHRDGEQRTVEAPGVVPHGRGVTHGATNQTDEAVLLTASLCPCPS